MRWLITACCLLLPCCVAAVADEDPSTRGRQQLRGEVARLMEELDSEDFETRTEAAAALKKLVARPELGQFLSEQFHRRLSSLDTYFEVRWHLKRWCKRLPPAGAAPAEKLSPGKIESLVAKLADDSFSVRSGAAQRLENLLDQEEYLPRIRETLLARLKAKPDAETAVQAKRLLELSRPAMVAECWREHEHVGEQHLLVDVPSMGPGAIRASHFDRIDDEVAHCVSGNNLSPGDYPVGVAFPHPNDPRSFFRLVNLPTPRRRRAYAEQVKIDDTVRLAAVSRRTLDRILKQKSKLGEREIIMLGQLDHKEVSRFAGKYFHLIDDGRLVPRAHGYADRRPSRFGSICLRLALTGTKEAIPELLAAIEKGCFMPPTAAAPQRVHWIAALSIARRDPWPESDAWLAKQIANEELLVWGREGGAEVGATAAGLLLTRHGEKPARFDLERSPEPLLMHCRIEGYRFADEEARRKTQQWWQDRKQASGDSAP